MLLVPLAAILVTLIAPPLTMALRRNWRRSVVVVWLLAVAATVYWIGASAIYADTLPGGSNQDALGVRTWFATFLTLGIVATIYAGLATRRPQRTMT